MFLNGCILDLTLEPAFTLMYWFGAGSFSFTLNTESSYILSEPESMKACEGVLYLALTIEDSLRFLMDPIDD